MRGNRRPPKHDVERQQGQQGQSGTSDQGSEGGGSTASHSDEDRNDAKTPKLGLLKTLDGAGLLANPQGGWSKLAQAKSAMWADEHSDG